MSQFNTVAHRTPLQTFHTWYAQKKWARDLSCRTLHTHTRTLCSTQHRGIDLTTPTAVSRLRNKRITSLCTPGVPCEGRTVPGHRAKNNPAILELFVTSPRRCPWHCRRSRRNCTAHYSVGSASADDAGRHCYATSSHTYARHCNVAFFSIPDGKLILR